MATKEWSWISTPVDAGGVRLVQLTLDTGDNTQLLPIARHTKNSLQVTGLGDSTLEVWINNRKDDYSSMVSYKDLMADALIALPVAAYNVLLLLSGGTDTGVAVTIKLRE